MLETLKKLDISSHIHLKHLLIDSNFIIASYARPDIYKPILNYFSRSDAVLVTIPLVAIEFLKGTNKVESYRVKSSFFNAMGLTVLPLDVETSNVVLDRVITAYGNSSSRASDTDLYLAATLMRYSPESVILLTANHKDFPTHIFRRKAVLPIDDGGEINTFALYDYVKNSF